MFYSLAEREYEHALNINVEFGTYFFFLNLAFHSIEHFVYPVLTNIRGFLPCTVKSRYSDHSKLRPFHYPDRDLPVPNGILLMIPHSASRPPH